MKGGQNLRDLQQRRKDTEEEAWVPSQPCYICQKMLPGAYGHTTLGERVVWSCSGVCETKVQQLRKEFYGALFPQQAQGIGTDVPPIL